MKGFTAVITSALLLSGCYSYEEVDYDGCYEPLTLSRDEIRTDYPRVVASREIENAGKIYVYGDTLLVAEKGHGLHIVNNRDKSHPLNHSFIEIPGNTDLAVKDEHLYIDSFTDLVVLDMSHLENINSVFRKQDIFPYAPNESLSDADKAKVHCPAPEDQDQLIIGYE